MDTVILKSAVSEVDAWNLGHAKHAPALAEVESGVLGAPLNGDRNLLNYKAMIVRQLLDGLNEKSGIVGSRSRALQAVQGVTSFAIPGDMSDIRSPVRSTVYEAITPGGGKNRGTGARRLLGPKIGRGADAASALRCPTGFEFGGRFATRGFGNCGRQLFDAVGGGGLNRSGFNLVGLLRREGELVGRGRYEGRAIQVERNARIPRVAAASPTKQNGSVSQAVAALANPDIDGQVLVRRDGQFLRPTVSANVLSTIRKNPDMADSVLITAVSDPKAIGQQEVPNLWTSGVRSVVFALPGGGSLSLSRDRTLTAADNRRLGRAWVSSSNSSDGDYDYGIRLRRLADESNGSLTYSETFPNIDNPNDRVTIAEVGKDNNTASFHRWVFNSYLSDNAPGRKDKEKSWREIETTAESQAVDANTIDSVNAATKHLNENGDPEAVPAEYLGAALERSKSFRSTPVRPGVTLIERGDSKRWFRTESEGKFSHLSERISADVHTALGLEAAPVKFIGTGDNRDVLIAHPENLSDGKVRRSTISDISPNGLLGVTVADWLLDNPNRDPASLMIVGRSDKTRLFATSNGAAALSGLSADELDRRRRVVLGDFLAESRNAQIAERFNSLALGQRKMLLDFYKDLLKRAEEFDWDDYTTRLGLDGELSAGEKSHIEIIKTMFARRLEQLRSQRKRFLSTVGVE